jgi:hypothetical protein
MSDLDVGEKCPACKRILPTSAFAANKSKLDGLRDPCRECGAAACRRRREAQGRTARRSGLPERHKHCLGRDEAKPWSEWHRNATASDGPASRCQACSAAKRRSDHSKRQYGITEAECDELIASRRGVCCICPSAPATHVDHRHNTGRVRGVLCFSCNAALGQFRIGPTSQGGLRHTWKETRGSQSS